jgi:inorganic triphosphatase YgiF
MSAALEIELKLRASEAALDALASLPNLGPAELGPPQPVDETDIYLDTPGGALAAARWACRLRTRDGHRRISVKGPAEHAAGDPLHRRPEVEGPAPTGAFEVPGAWPDSAARDLVLRLAGDEPLAEVLRLRQRRIERPALVDGRRVALLSLDRVVVERDGVALGDMRVVELELEPGIAEDTRGGLIGSLRARDGLEPEPESKLERALELARGAAEADG